MNKNKIAQCLQAGRPICSFEFFPPKTAKGEAALRQSLRELAEAKPDFVSVTYGAGGSTREKTHDLVLEIAAEYDMPVMPHLTCAGHTFAAITAQLKEYAAAGIGNVLALRGDPPREADSWQAVPGGPQYASELFKTAQEVGGFSIGVAGFPETHPEAPDLQTDLRYLKEKINAGAEFVITQLFFDNRFYADYRVAALAAGINVPLIPGVMPVTKLAQLGRFREMCGCSIPPALEDALRRGGDDPVRVEEAGLAFCAAQCADLLAKGAPGIHFYTLNQSSACLSVHAALRALGYFSADSDK